MFNSLLFQDIHQQPAQVTTPAAFLTDLHLDQVLAAVRPHLDATVAASLLQPLTSIAAINDRQAIFTDLRHPELAAAAQAFARELHRLDGQRTRLPRLFSNESRWLSLVSLLADTEQAVNHLTAALQAQSLTATGLLGLRRYLLDYQQRPATRQLRAAIRQAQTAVTHLTYRLDVQGRKVTVLPAPPATTSLAAQLTAVFRPVMAQTVDLTRPVNFKAPDPVGRLNNLQIKVIDQLVTLYPDQFAVLQHFQAQYADYADPLLQRVGRELTFFLAWRQLEDQITQRFSVTFCLPTMTTRADERVTASFDLALARTLLTQATGQLVTNDFTLTGAERFLIISGPNQGGKTTYARMVGELYYLARLGVPIPGHTATLRLRPRIATHFDRQESQHPLTGLLADDLQRIHQIIQTAVPGELVIMNELFSSTATQDAETLAKRVLQRLAAKGACGIYVTFLSHLGTFPNAVSMMSQLTRHDHRTYRVIRQVIDDHAYATALLAHYHLTQADLEKGVEHHEG